MMIPVPQRYIKYIASTASLLGLYLGVTVGMCMLAPALGAESRWTLVPLTLGCGLGGGAAVLSLMRFVLPEQAKTLSVKNALVAWAGAWLAVQALGLFLEKAFGYEMPANFVLNLLLWLAGVLAVFVDEPGEKTARPLSGTSSGSAGSPR